MPAADLKLRFEFSAGAQLLFNNEKFMEASLDGSRRWTVRDLLPWMHDNMLTGNGDLFLKDGTVRPGLLLVINDTDWELMGELDYELQSNDHLHFISSLHGG